MVAITIILAAVIGTFVLGFGGQDSPPNAAWTADQDEDPFLSSVGSEIAAAGNIESDDAVVTIAHDGGDNVDTDNLEVNLPDSDAEIDANDDDLGLEGTLRSGDTVTIDFADGGDVDYGDGDVEDGDRVTLVWDSGDQSQILASHTLNIEEDPDNGT